MVDLRMEVPVFLLDREIFSVFLFRGLSFFRNLKQWFDICPTPATINSKPMAEELGATVEITAGEVKKHVAQSLKDQSHAAWLCIFVWRMSQMRKGQGRVYGNLHINYISAENSANGSVYAVHLLPGRCSRPNGFRFWFEWEASTEYKKDPSPPSI